MADVVASLKGLENEEYRSFQRALIVEIVGPAGAGKTTLFRALTKADPLFRCEFLPAVWDFENIPFFVKNIFQLAPTLLQMQGQGGRNLTRRELAWMAMLKGWPDMLRKKADGDHKVILLDQGPIFLMAILSEFGPESLQNPKIAGYWKKTIEQWIPALDMVICLDTLDEILINRIRNRQDEHLMKDKADHEIKDFLAKYRRVYGRLINTITRDKREIRVLHMDTGKISVDDVIRCVLLNLPYGY